MAPARLMTKLVVKTQSRSRTGNAPGFDRPRIDPGPPAVDFNRSQLDCIYSITMLTGEPDQTLDQFLKRVVCLLPTAWPRQNQISARLTFDGRPHSTDGFTETDDVLLAPIQLARIDVGQIELFVPSIPDQSIPGDYGQSLVDAAARLVSNYVYRHRAEHALDTLCRHQFSIFESIDEPVYVSDPETYKLIYTNESFNRCWGQGIGDKCHEVVYGLDTPCSFCANEKILGKNLGKTEIHEARNDKTGRWFHHIDRAIPWPDGRMVHYDMAIDITHRKDIEHKLKEANARLEAESEALGYKNVALREVLDQIESEKKTTGMKLQANINKVIMPLLRSLASTTDASGTAYIELLEDCLTEITSPFIRDLELKHSSLSPRETEICNMIKSGLSSKDIATALHTSVHTVLKQRQRIRTKFGLARKKVNLVAYLQSI